MKILLHGDDLGASFSGNRCMFDCVDNGSLNSVSLLANGVAFSDALQGLRKRPELRVALHLNLFERQPLAPASDVNVLIGESGEFSLGFAGLWWYYLRSDAQERGRIRKAVTLEFTTQLERACDALGPEWPVAVDGHVHMHMIPFVFDCLLDLADRFRIQYIRLPREPFSLKVAGPLGWCTPNAGKLVLLRLLSQRRVKDLQRSGIGTCDRFYGLLHTGVMSESALLRIIEHAQSGPDGRLAEIVLHPAGADAEEAHLWKNNQACLRMYRSPRRIQECEALKAPAVRERLARLTSA